MKKILATIMMALMLGCTAAPAYAADVPVPVAEQMSEEAKAEALYHKQEKENFAIFWAEFRAGFKIHMAKEYGNIPVDILASSVNLTEDYKAGVIRAEIISPIRLEIMYIFVVQVGGDWTVVTAVSASQIKQMQDIEDVSKEEIEP